MENTSLSFTFLAPLVFYFFFFFFFLIFFVFVSLSCSPSLFFLIFFINCAFLQRVRSGSPLKSAAQQADELRIMIVEDNVLNQKVQMSTTTKNQSTLTEAKY